MEEVGLDHIIYTLIPYRGYGVRAWSRREVIYEIEQAFKGWFAPYEQAVVRPGHELRAVVKDPRDRVYLSRVCVGERLDELKRSGVVSHIAVIPLEYLLKKMVSLEEIDKAMLSYINSRGIEQGDIEPIKINVEAYEVDKDLEYYKKTVGVEQTRKILSGVSKPYGKVVVVCKKDIWSRIRLAYTISKVLAIHGVREYVVLTEKPIDNILMEYDNLVLVLDKMIPLKQTGEWTVVKIAEDEKEKGGLDVEETIKKIYG